MCCISITILLPYTRHFLSKSKHSSKNWYFMWSTCLSPQVDEFPVNEAVALQQAGLQAQVLWGNFEPSKMSRYDEIEEYLPARIINNGRTRTRDEWRRAIADAHRVRMCLGVLDFTIRLTLLAGTELLGDFTAFCIKFLAPWFSIQQ